MRKNKYNYLWVIQGFYGDSWEDLSEYDKKEYSYKDVLHDYREYKVSDSYPKRLIKRRVLNEE